MSEAETTTVARADDRSTRAQVRRRRLTFFWVVAAAIVVVDQVAKRWVDASYGLSKPYAGAAGPIVAPTPIIGDLVRISKTYNDGALFGMFSSTATVFAIGSLVVVGFIVWYETTQGHRGHWLLTVALTLLMGGAVGNLIDRLRQGYVVDFVDMGIGASRWYTSNLADGCISLSIVLLLVLSLLGDRLGGAEEASPAAGSTHETRE